MIKVRGLQKSYGPLTVLTDVSFALGRGQRAALVGHNGTGKSTLLKILAGLEQVDAGSVELDPGTRIGYLPQDTSLVGDEPLIHYLRRITGIDVLEQELDSLAERLSDPRTREHYEEVRVQYDRVDGYSFAHRVDVMLTGFGLDGIDQARPLSGLSSGQKSKVALIGILLQEADLLLLDEPTNNLDLPALIWVEDFLRNSRATAVIVSHDRRFLDRVASKILELDWRTHTATVTSGGYTDYLSMVERRRERQKEQYRLQQEEIARLTERARSLKQQASQGARWSGSDSDKFLRGFKRDRASKSGKGAKAIEKRIEQMDLIEKPLERPPLEILISADPGHGDRDIQLQEVVAGYPDGFTVGPVTLTIRFGSRIGIMGLNGSGKSTLLKTAVGHLKPLSGRVLVGSGVTIGNMMQEHDLLPRSLTPIEFLGQRADLNTEQSWSLLAKFGLGEVIGKHQIATLSPGGRARLLLAYFSTRATNTLVLDEPTNHLDLEAMEALEEALTSYGGTIIVVSHDRYFIDKVGLDTIYEIKDGRLAELKNYDRYLNAAEDEAKRLLRLL